MSLAAKVTEAIGRRIIGPEFQSRLMGLEQENTYLHESLTRITLELEEMGWKLMGTDSDEVLDRDSILRIQKRSLLMALKNPIVKRAVKVQSDYIFAQGVTISHSDDAIQEDIKNFWYDLDNQRVFTGHPKLLQRERELQVYGNLFFAFFPSKDGDKIRLIDPLEVSDIVRNPEDFSDDWLYRREYTVNGKTKIVYHPRIGLTQVTITITPTDGEIMWDAPVYHLCEDIYGKMKFGVPELWAQLDWATAYKAFLEDWCTIMRSYARMAMKISGLGGKKGVAAAKSMLTSTVSSTNPRETNPSPTAGSFFLSAGNANAEPIKTAGATTSADEGKPILTMAAAANGLPNTFFGDASVGNFATAKTLDRPTELKMLSRQELWKFAVMMMIVYSIGKKHDPKAVMKGLTIMFPSILERNVTDRVRAVVNAITLFGKPLTNLIPDRRLACRLLMEAMNVPDIDRHLKEFEAMWAKTGTKMEIPEPPPPPAGGGAVDPSQGGAVGNNG